MQNSQQPHSLQERCKKTNYVMLWKRTGFDLILIMYNPVFNLDLCMDEHWHQAFSGRLGHHLRLRDCVVSGVVTIKSGVLIFFPYIYISSHVHTALQTWKWTQARTFVSCYNQDHKAIIWHNKLIIASVWHVRFHTLISPQNLIVSVLLYYRQLRWSDYSAIS